MWFLFCCLLSRCKFSANPAKRETKVQLFHVFKMCRQVCEGLRKRRNAQSLAGRTMGSAGGAGNRPAGKWKRAASFSIFPPPCFFIRRRVRRADGWRMTWGHKKTCFPPFPSDGSGRKHACSVFTYRSRFRGGHLRSRLCLLYAVGQFGTGFEFYHFLSGNFNFCTSGRVNASAGGTF